jgi:methylated-DNA-protein-cysteine methyltransferase-like protein
MHFSSPTEMEELLIKEGVIVKNDQIVAFKTLFWDPMIELEM